MLATGLQLDSIARNSPAMLLQGYIPDPMDAVFDPYSSPAADPRDALLERYTGSRIPLHQPGFNLLNGNQDSQQHPMHALNMGGLHGQQPVVAPTSSSTELMAAFFSIIDVTSENRDSASCGLQQTGSDEAEVQGQRTGDMTRSDQTLSTDVFSRQHSHAPVPSAVSNIRSAQEDEVVAAQLETPGLDAGHAAADLAKSRIKGRSAARFRSSACSQRVTMGQVTADATAALSSAIDASGVSSHPFQAPRSSGAASLSHQSRGPGVEPMDGLQYAEGQQTAHRPQFAATSQSQSIHRHHHRQPAVSAVQSQLDFTQYMAQQEAGSTLRSSNAQKSSKVRTAGVQTRYQPHMHAPHQASARSALLGQEGGRSRAEAAQTRHQQQQQPAQQQMGVSKAAPSGSALVGLLARQSKQAQHGAAEQQMSWTRVTPRVSTEADSKMLQLRRSKAAAAAVGHCSDTKQSTNCRVPQPQQRMHRAPGPSRLGPFHPTAGDVFRFAQSSSVPPAQCLVDGAPGQPAAGASSAFMPAIHRVPDDVAGVTASCGWSAAPPTHHQQGLTEFASSAEQPKSTFAQFAAAAVAGNPLSSGTQTLHRRGLTARSLQHFGGQRGAEAGGGCHPDIQSAVPLADNDPDAHMDTNRHSNAVCPAQHSGGHRDAQAEEGCQQDMQSADSHPVSYTNGRTNRNSIAARPAHRFGGHRGATADGGCQQDIQSAAVPAERPFSLQTTQVNSGTCTHEAYASGGNQCLDAAAAAGCQQDSQSTDNMDIDSSHYDPVTNYTQHQADGNLLHEAQAPPANSFNTNPTTTDLAKSSLQPALSRRPLLGQDSLNSEATYAAHVGSEFMVGRQQLGNAGQLHLFVCADCDVVCI